MPLSVYYTPKVCITQPKFFVSGHHPYFSQNDASGQGQTRKKMKQKVLLYNKKDPLLIYHLRDPTNIVGNPLE